MFFAIINFNKTIEINDKLCYGYIAHSYFVKARVLMLPDRLRIQNSCRQIYMGVVG